MSKKKESSAGAGDPAMKEAYYNEGATPLFLAIEETEWRQALQIAQDNPGQVDTWVVSTGTVETTFHWNLWRRLPLHEACRRQAPAWFISYLLSVHPTGARQRTQFGELPLHLAVECGSPPEVVNLLIVAYWPAIVATDQSGRTPLSICEDAEMLDMEEHQVVNESLTRSMETYQQMMSRHELDVESLKASHAAGLEAIRKQHDDDLQVEQDQQEKLLQEVKRLKGIIKDAEGTSSKKSQRIDEATASNQALHRQVQTLQDELKEEQARGEALSRRAQALEKTIQERDATIENLKKHIMQLQLDMQQIGKWQDNELQAKINTSEETMQVMVEHFCSLTESLSQQHQKFRQLMVARGISVRGGGSGGEGGGQRKSASVAPATAKDEKKDASEDVDDVDALNMAAVAASGALGLLK